jgi:hypothetical protein
MHVHAGALGLVQVTRFQACSGDSQAPTKGHMEHILDVFHVLLVLVSFRRG